MFDFLGTIFAYPFRWIDTISPNYVVMLILFAILMKLLLFPMGIKQQKNSIKQAKLRPYETIIRKKYAGRTDNVSKQKMNEEIMNLYQKEGFNPASGCLPMLLQLPIIFALYQVIINPAKFLLQFPGELLTRISDVYKGLMDVKELGFKAATEIGQINGILSVDKAVLPEELATELQGVLSTPVGNGTVESALEGLRDSFTVFGINLMDTPTFGLNLLIIIPILVFVFSWGSMKLTRKFTYQPQSAQDNATKSSMALMDVTMPLMSTFICFSMPAGIGIYWIIQNILGVVQQFALYKMFPIPKMTEEDLKNAELQLKGKQKKEKYPAKVETAATKAPASSKKKGQAVKKACSISAHARARVRENGRLPRATRRIGR